MSLTRVLYSDWEQIYSDGALLIEGHSISAADWLRVVRADVEELDMSVLPNDDFQIDNLAEAKDLSAIRAAKAGHVPD